MGSGVGQHFRSEDTYIRKPIVTPAGRNKMAVTPIAASVETGNEQQFTSEPGSIHFDSIVIADRFKPSAVAVNSS